MEASTLPEDSEANSSIAPALSITSTGGFDHSF